MVLSYNYCDWLLQVRLYTAKKLYHQLEQARTEFIQANVMVRKQTIFLPKVLHFYAKDAALELPDLIDMVCESMPELQQKEIKQYLRRRVESVLSGYPTNLLSDTLYIGVWLSRNYFPLYMCVLVSNELRKIDLCECI